MADDQDTEAFLPVAETMARLEPAGLETALRSAIESAFDGLRAIRASSTFVAPGGVMQLLSSLPYDPADDVWILSRNDHPGFWTDSRREQYLGYLRAHRGDLGINQNRLLVYDDASAHQIADVDDIMFALRELHREGTLLTVSAASVNRVDVLAPLRWGCTVSTKYEYAVIASPPLDGDSSLLGEPAVVIPSLLSRYPEYDTSVGPLSAIVTADGGYVRSILEALQSLARDSLSSMMLT